MTPRRRRLPFLVRPEAAADVEAAAEWYESEGVGLGAEFIRAVAVCMSAIRRWPTAYRVAFPELEPSVRRALLRRFSYSIYYVTTEARTSILACLHLRRDPDEIRGQVVGRVRDV